MEDLETKLYTFINETDGKRKTSEKVKRKYRRAKT